MHLIIGLFNLLLQLERKRDVIQGQFNRPFFKNYRMDTNFGRGKKSLILGWLVWQFSSASTTLPGSASVSAFSSASGIDADDHSHL